MDGEGVIFQRVHLLAPSVLPVAEGGVPHVAQKFLVYGLAGVEKFSPIVGKEDDAGSLGAELGKQGIQKLSFHIDHDDIFLVRVVEILQLTGDEETVGPLGIFAGFLGITGSDGDLPLLFQGLCVPAPGLQGLDGGQVLIIIDRVEVQHFPVGDEEKVSKIIPGVGGEGQSVADLFAQGIPSTDGHLR